MKTNVFEDLHNHSLSPDVAQTHNISLSFEQLKVLQDLQVSNYNKALNYLDDLLDDFDVVSETGRSEIRDWVKEQKLNSI